MKALILAAGRGERLRPFTDTTPKPLLVVRGKPLIEWHLEALARAGVRDVVINTAWLEAQFPAALGDGSRWGLRLQYSMEGRDHGGALETAGGIAKALPMLGDVFWVVSGDVYLHGYPFDAAAAARLEAARHVQAHLWLVPNAPHHPAGDFGIDAAGRLSLNAPPLLTWASVGVFRASLFDGIVPGTRLPLRPVLMQGIAAGTLTGARWGGEWTDVGTVERWQQLERPLDTP
jgi:MurNAc alpha-1-phosphate uridylyltransferase